ncbi:hypothetical protein [Rhabdochlamydiaceae symbiont of Dictyostelium giganteum]|uniref:hypothetical protein n=1 Tax=Rhabdochlamydiaceae symbiont of Dictyostelium giganteum TaxID=3342349 RepID=UPI00384D06BA
MTGISNKTGGNQDAFPVHHSHYIQGERFKGLNQRVQEKILTVMDSIGCILGDDYQFMGTALYISSRFILVPQHALQDKVGYILFKGSNELIQATTFIDGTSDPQPAFLADYKILQVTKNLLGDLKIREQEKCPLLGRADHQHRVIQLQYKIDQEVYMTDIPFSLGYQTLAKKSVADKNLNDSDQSGSILCSGISGEVYGVYQGGEGILKIDAIYSSLQNITLYSDSKEKRINALHVMLDLQFQMQEAPYAKTLFPTLLGPGQILLPKRAPLIQTFSSSEDAASFEEVVRQDVLVFLENFLDSTELKKYCSHRIWQPGGETITFGDKYFKTWKQFKTCLQIEKSFPSAIHLRMQGGTMGSVVISKSIEAYVQGRLNPLTGRLISTDSSLGEKTHEENTEKMISVMNYLLIQLKKTVFYWKEHHKRATYTVELFYQKGLRIQPEKN